MVYAQLCHGAAADTFHNVYHGTSSGGLGGPPTTMILLERFSLHYLCTGNLCRINQLVNSEEVSDA